MYRLARNHQGLVTTIRGSGTWTRRTKPPGSCLAQANGRRRVGYVELGLMEGEYHRRFVGRSETRSVAGKSAGPRKIDEGAC